MTKAKLAPAKASEKKCSYCGNKHTFPEPGNGSGNGVTLGNNLSPGRDSHPWQLKGNAGLTGYKKRKYFKTNSIQAHHLIASSVIRNGKSSRKTWKTMCTRFGYDINKKENGVWLPSVMALACQLGVPLHRGGHPPSYYLFAKNKIKSIMDSAATGGYCPSNHGNFVSDLDAQSKVIFNKVKKFAAVLTSDAHDYMPGGKGCGGSSSVSDKSSRTCNRQHGLPVGAHKLGVGK
jgi:hypothetical protein